MEISEKDFFELRNKVIEKEFENLNGMQRKAVLKTDGFVLILAGAGSGKTTVLINRIINIMKYGCAYGSNIISSEIDDQTISQMRYALESGEIKDCLAEKIAVEPCPAHRILAVTFTNKAANELKERLEVKLGSEGKRVCATTFHSFCAGILRRYADKLGYEKAFTIYDTEDAVRTIKNIQESLNISDDKLKTKSVLHTISKAKNDMILPEEFEENAQSDFRKQQIAQIYKEYAKTLKSLSAMDFDDLLLNVILLFKEFPEIEEKYSTIFKYIMIDEYQDTNLVQYELVKLLSQKNNNLCVVGDDDQSIYKFRGATIENILGFEKDFPNTTIIKLEQNYRSTKNILNVANALIGNNVDRKKKILWTENEEGEKVHVHTSLNEHDEADYIIEQIKKGGGKFSEYAILYRMNAQSNAIEKHMVKERIPYRMLCGHRFLDREEIKDMISYLSVTYNPNDTLRIKRIINKPRRAIGEKTVSTVENISKTSGVSFFEVLCRIDEFNDLKRANNKLSDFCNMIKGFIEYYNTPGVTILDLYEKILADTNYVDELQGTKQKKREREENIEELKTNIADYERRYGEEASLFGFLEEVSLMADIDNYNQDTDAVIMMTIHSAKGLEFNNVFIPGFENGIFPGIQNLNNTEALQEERRLAYVAITRAKKRLYMVNTTQRLLFGKTSSNPPSLFTAELPEEHISITRKENWSKINCDSEFMKKDLQKELSRSIKSAQLFTKSPKIKNSKSNTDNCDFQLGDKVNHKLFGIGTVKDAKPMGNDVMLTIEFEKVGNKMIMKNFAKLVKVE